MRFIKVCPNSACGYSDNISSSFNCAKCFTSLDGVAAARVAAKPSIPVQDSIAEEKCEQVQLRQAEETIRKWKCASCGFKNQASDEKCINCSTTIGSTDEKGGDERGTTTARKSDIESNVERFYLSLPNSKRIDLDTPIIIGRDRERVQAEIFTLCEGRLDVSRLHAWIGCIGSDLIFIDLSSKNGASIDGAPVLPCSPVFLTGGSFPVAISIGRNLVFRVLREVVSE